VEILPEHLRQVVAFRNASEEELGEILVASTVRGVEEGEYFFLQGDPAERAYVLLQGQVKLLQSNPQGQSVNLRTVSAWQLFGALGVVRDVPEYPASAQAMVDCSALAVPSEFLKAMFRSTPRLSMDLMQLMTSYIQEMQSRYVELATQRVEQRICRTLLRLVSQSGRKVSDAVELTFSREDLAEMSGTTVYTVSRTLADWSRRGLVETGRERVRILQPHALVRLAEGLP